MFKRLLPLLLVSSLICAPFLKASPITGQAFTATSSDGQSFSGTVGSGAEIQWGAVNQGAWGGMYIDFDATVRPEIYVSEYGYVLPLSGVPITINVVFPNLTTFDFTGINHLYQNSAGGWTSLTAATNTLSYSFYGRFDSGYGFPYTDIWGYTLQTNPNANGGDTQGGGSSVPDGGMTVGLLGFALVGIAALRRKFGQG